MTKSGFTASLGFIILLGVLFAAVMERNQTQISYFDWHAALVVLGGVGGSLLMALEGRVLKAMALDWGAVIFGKDSARGAVASFKDEVKGMQAAWTQGRRAEVLNLVENGATKEVRVAAETLVQHMQGHRLTERFESLRTEAQDELVPQIEGWDMIARLAPAFGIVGTVAGMVQLFRNMANESGNLGGAMAMALLATLYGILLGTALGGPMSTRLSQVLSEHLGMIDLLQAQVAAMIEEDKRK
jgi:chemotaxis protein MotA